MEISQKSRKFTVIINKEEEGGYSSQYLEPPAQSVKKKHWKN
jgi:hypothetical protein